MAVVIHIQRWAVVAAGHTQVDYGRTAIWAEKVRPKRHKKPNGFFAFYTWLSEFCPDVTYT